MPNTFFDPSEQEKDRKPDPSVDAFRLPLHGRRRNEVRLRRRRRRRRRRRPTAHCSTFVEQRPSGNSTAIAGYSMCLNSCNTGRHSQHVRPCTQACSERGSTKQRTQIYTDGHTHTHTHTHTVHSLTWASEFMPRFLDVRRSSATDTAALVSTLLSDVWPKPAL